MTDLGCPSPSFFEPDIILPGDSSHRGAEGERRLIAAMLCEALDTALRIAAFRTTFEVVEARRWILDERTDPMSFRWTCDMLGLNPHLVRVVVETHGRKKRRWSPALSRYA